jgi:putative sugar O-methyltransferase
VSRFAESCFRMRGGASSAQLGQYWNAESGRMLERIATYPDAALFSSEFAPLHVFGGGAMTPDSSLARRPLAIRALARCERAVRRLLGYGQLSERLVRLISDDEAVRHAFLYANVSYRNAVMAGALLLRPAIETHDIRAHASFGEQRVDVEGRPLSWLTLVALRHAVRLRELVGEGHVFLEVGGGTGELTRMLLRTGVARRAIIVDIPPALAFSQEHLASDFGDDAIGFFDPHRQGIDDGKRCTFLTPDQVALIRHADAGVNMGSFQEMPATTVAGYIDVCKNAGLRHFVSVNTRQAHSVNATQGVDELFYESTFAPEFKVAARLEWQPSLKVQLEEHAADYAGYQGLHFVRAS